MPLTYSEAVANARLDQVETTIGAAAVLRLYSGTVPANVGTALSGQTLLAQGTLPSDYLSAASARQKVRAGTWTLTGQAGAGAGTAATFFRVLDNAGTTAHIQGTVTAQVALTTNALTAANGNVLNFASTTGVQIGMNVSGTGVPVGSTVVATTGTTVTLSNTSTAGVASGASITFGGDMVLDNNSIANAQSVNVSTFTLTAGN
jgi:hypothetical protein